MADPQETAKHPPYPNAMPTRLSTEKSRPVQRRDDVFARRQPARKSKTNHSVIISGVVPVREAPTTKQKARHGQEAESGHITISFETRSLPSIGDFELPQQLRDRASLTSEPFAADRTASLQVVNTTSPAIWRRSNTLRNVSPYRPIDVDDHSSSQADAVNNLLNEVPAAQKFETDGSKSTSSQCQYPHIPVDLQRVQNLVFKIQDHLHHLGRLLGATQSTWPPVPYDPDSVGDMLLNDYRDTIGQWLNGIIDTPELNSNLKELFKHFPTARLVHGRIVAALQESQNMVEMEYDGLRAEKWVLRDIRA